MDLSNTFKFGLLGAAALALTACGESKEEALAYDTVEACTNAGQHDQAVCEAEFEKAQQRHTELAPRYASQNACYTDFGYNQCRVHNTSGGSLWLPFMVGYMLAPRGVSTVYTQPLYRPSRNPGKFYTGAGNSIGSVASGGRTQVARSTVSQSAARTRTVSRGGFGARATSSGG